MQLSPPVVNKILHILKSGDTVELKLEKHRLVIVRIRRSAEKTDIQIDN